jgi:hypothetical protein
MVVVARDGIESPTRAFSKILTLRLPSRLRCWITKLNQLSEVLKRSNKGENACGAWYRVRSVPCSFNELRDVAEMNRKCPASEGRALPLWIL